jgi:glycosyltransferase involved in cell wall biosynthesis
VTFVAPSPRARGGIAQFSARLAEAIGRRHEVQYIAYRRLYPRWTRAGKLQGESDTASSVPFSPVLIPWLPWTWWSAARRIGRFGPGLLVVQWWHPIMGPCLWFLARRARRKGTTVVVVCHNARPHERFPAGTMLTRRTLGRADALMALSAPVAEELAELVPQVPLRVMGHPPNLNPRGVDDPMQSNGHVPVAERIGSVDGPIILFFGYVRPYKGLDDLISAMPAIRAEVPATLVVAGPFFEPVERFRRQADELQVGDAVRLFPGYVPDDDVPGLFDAADVLALPYRSASQSGILPLAATFRVPVVATAVGGIPDSIGDRGVIVPPSDPPELASGVVKALRERPLPPGASGTDWAAWAREIAEVRRRPTHESGRRSVLLRVGLGLLWLLVAYFVGRVLLDGLRGLRGEHITFDPWFMVASTFLVLLARITDVASWHLLVRGTGATVPVPTAARVFTTAEMVRFLPGGALHLAARYRFAGKVGVPPPAVVATTALDLALRILLGLMLFVVSLPFWTNMPHFTQWLAILAIPALAAIVYPPFLEWMIAKASHVLHRQWEPVRISMLSVATCAVITAVGWVFRGVAVYLVGRSLVGSPIDLLMPIAGASALAWVTGVLTPFAPGGLGVREAAGASLMSRFMPVANGIVILLVSRVQALAVEIVTTGLAVAWDRMRGRRRERESHAAAAVGATSVEPTVSVHGTDA